MRSTGRICVLHASRKGKWWETINCGVGEDWEATRDYNLGVCIFFFLAQCFVFSQSIHFCPQYYSLCKLYSLFNKTFIERVNTCFSFEGLK